jgi:HAD superfamily hydrolase (TIGR01549 family)
MFEAVIFDWDGTLADTKQVILKSFHAALREVAHLDVDDDFIVRRIGVGAALTFRDILTAKGLPADEGVLKRLVDVKIRVSVDQAAQVKLFPGAVGLLEALNGKLKIGLASMNNRPVIEQMLKVLDLNKYFGVVVTVNEVTKSKPDPEIFLKTAQQLGSRPENCVVLEDSIFGVKAAKAGNMSCIAVTQGAYTRGELEEAKPDLIVKSLTQKTDLLNFILN